MIQRRLRTLLPALLLSATAVGCSGNSGEEDDDDASSGGDSATSDDTGEAPAFGLSSAAFAEGETIPTAHECGPPIVSDGPGDNLTPPLSWTAGPEGTASYALVMRDLDFTPAQYPEGLIHWVIYDLPAEVRSLAEGIEDGADVVAPAGAHQAELQGSGFFGYLGPCSPSSVNTYRFTLHAMGEASLTPDDTSELTVAELVESSSLASVSLSGES